MLVCLALLTYVATTVNMQAYSPTIVTKAAILICLFVAEKNWHSQSDCLNLVPHSYG